MMEYNIAVVDDDPMTLVQAKSLLSEEGMIAVCMTSGEQLLKYVEDNTPDLILLDIMMPEIDGFETYIMLRRFEEHTGRARIPVIFISGDEDSETEEMGLVMGASDFIKKPLVKDVLLRRIEHSVKASRRLEYLREEATVDKLTGFLNKAKGVERVSKLCGRKTGALMILDLDSFKLVNDLFGHEEGDKMLEAFADIVRKNSRETDTLCRIGGDEFLGFYEDLTDERAVGSLTARLNKQLVAGAGRLLGKDHGIPLGISIGVVMVPEYGTEYKDLFALADSALYKVKQNGKHGYLIYGSEEDDSQVRESAQNKLDRLLQIIEERNEKSGAMFIGKDQFSAVYKYIMRFFKRYGGEAVMLLFELESAEDGAAMAEAAEAFGKVVEKILRMSDIMVQYGRNSFMVMLTKCTKDDIDKVTDRITQSFKETEYGKDIDIKCEIKEYDFT